jgi:hypothetical protein
MRYQPGTCAVYLEGLTEFECPPYESTAVESKLIGEGEPEVNDCDAVW